MRVKILKDTFHYKKDEIVEVSNNEAFGLIDSGCGILTKDMTERDYKVTETPVLKVKKLRSKTNG